MFPTVSVRWLFANSLLLVVLLVLPLVVSVVGPAPRIEVYRGIHRPGSNFAHMGREAFDETGDIDILFLGSSLQGFAVDGPILRQALKEHGRTQRIMIGSKGGSGIQAKKV